MTERKYKIFPQRNRYLDTYLPTTDKICDLIPQDSPLSVAYVPQPTTIFSKGWELRI